jgi:hypothetical protein
MKVRTAACVAAFGLFLFFGFAPNMARSADIPPVDLANLLDESKLPTPWHIDQVSYENRGPRWQVDVYYKPQQISPEVCVADVATLIVSGGDETYSIEDRQTSQRVLALGSCGNAWSSGGNFGDLTGDITNRQLKMAIKTAFAVSGYRSDSRVKFESEELRPLLRNVDKSHIHWVEKQGSGDIILGFFAGEISPDVLAIRVSNNGKGPVYVYRENGPDITSKR